MKKFQMDKLARSSLFVFALSMITNVLTYAYQIAMGNLMSPADYGTINTMLSLSTLISIPSGMITALAANLSARYRAQQQDAALAAFTRQLIRFAALFALLVLAVGALASPLAAAVLQVDNTRYIQVVVLISAIGCITTALSGVLQGMQRFAAYSAVNITSTALRLLLGIAFALAGWRIGGALGALTLAAVGATLYGAFALRDVLRAPAEAGVRLDYHVIRNYFLRSFFFQAFLLLMANGDVLLIKAFAADPADAGIYSSGSVIGKIALYLSNSVVVVLLPLVAERSSKGGDTTPLFKKSLLLGGCTVFVCSAGIVTVGKPLINILFGEQYRQATELLLPIAVYVVPVALLTILINYLMPLGRVRFFTFTMTAAYLVIFVVIGLWCREVDQMLYVMGAALFAAFLANTTHILLHPPQAVPSPEEEQPS